MSKIHYAPKKTASECLVGKIHISQYAVSWERLRRFAGGDLCFIICKIIGTSKSPLQIAMHVSQYAESWERLRRLASGLMMSLFYP